MFIFFEKDIRNTHDPTAMEPRRIKRNEISIYPKNERIENTIPDTNDMMEWYMKISKNISFFHSKLRRNPKRMRKIPSESTL